MQIVINIPDDIYSTIVKQYRKDKELQTRDNLYKAIVNGTPLPKGHKRLMILSEDKVKENQVNLDFSCQKWISEVDLSNAVVTIIEADVESEGKE